MIKNFIKRYEIQLVIIGFILLLAWNAGLFKPTNYLVCKHKYKGSFYLKIIQREYRAFEYDNSNFKDDFIVRSFDINIRQNYISFTDDLSQTMEEFSKSQEMFSINRTTLDMNNGPQVIGKCENTKKGKKI